MNESSQDDVGVGNLFAQNDEEAKHRFSIYKSKDPFPEIPPALLNSADIFDYVAKTGMIYPFNPSETKLKSASYEIDLFGEIHFWDDKKKKQVIKLEKGKRFPLEKNSIAFVSLETIFRLPDYIALRFNFRIKHVHRACRKTTLSVTGASWPPSFLSTVAVLSVLPTPMPCLLTCRPVPGPASVCAECRRGETGDLPSPASATDVPWAC